GDIDLEMPKRGLDMPVVVDEVPFWLESESESEGSVSTHTSSYSSATTESTGTAQTTSEQYDVRNFQTGNQTGLAETLGNFGAMATTTGWSVGEGHGTSSSRSHGRSQTLK